VLAPWHGGCDPLERDRKKKNDGNSSWKMLPGHRPSGK